MRPTAQPPGWLSTPPRVCLLCTSMLRNSLETDCLSAKMASRRGGHLPKVTQPGCGEAEVALQQTAPNH